MDITYFGHAAFRINVGSSVILVDPFLTGNRHFQGDVSSAVAGATHIVITHGHQDHVGDTLRIAAETGAQAIANAELAGWLNKKGVEKVIRANTGGTVRLPDFSLTLTQAFHSSSQLDERGFPIYLGMPNGVVLKFPEAPTVYHMGDTDIFGDMALIEELHRPRIGMVPVGDYFTMGAESAALACRRFFSFDTIIPTHWGTTPNLDPSPAAFIAAMGERAGRVKVPAVGEPLAF